MNGKFFNCLYSDVRDTMDYGLMSSSPWWRVILHCILASHINTATDWKVVDGEHCQGSKKIITITRVNGTNASIHDGRLFLLLLRQSVLLHLNYSQFHWNYFFVILFTIHISAKFKYCM